MPKGKPYVTITYFKIFQRLSSAFFFSNLNTTKYLHENFSKGTEKTEKNMSSSFLSDPKREHFESTSRHGSVAFEWSKESGNTPDLSHHHQDNSTNNNSSSSTTQNNNNNSTNVNNNNVSSPSTAVEMNRTGNNNNQQQYSPIHSANSNDSKYANNNNSNSNDNNSNSLSSILNSSLSPQMLQERIQRFFIPVQIVGVLLFNPTISIDDGGIR